jgi:hypothetical protein
MFRRNICLISHGDNDAGLGICSRLPSASHPPKKIILTDVGDVVPLLQANIALNEVMCSYSGVRDENLFKSYTAMPHFWGDSVESLNSAVISCTADVTTSPYGGLLVVASDVVYDPAGYRPLVTSISALLHHHQTLYSEMDGNTRMHCQPPLMVLTHRHRNPENKK